MIVFSRWDRSPAIIEDQVTYPLVTRMMGLPRVKTVRGISDYGYSWVYVIFEDGTDPYWARTRVQEQLADVAQSLPAGVKTELGPDAERTGLGFPICPRPILPATTTPDNCAPCRTGTSAITCGQFREWPKWRPWAGLNRSIR